MNNQTNHSLRLQGEDNLVSSATRKKIRQTVVIAHLALLILPMLVMLVYQWLKPTPRERIRVNLVSLPESENTAASGVRTQTYKKKVKRAKVKPKKRIKTPSKVHHKSSKSRVKRRKRVKPVRKSRPTVKKRSTVKPKRHHLLSAKDIIISRQITTSRSRRTRKLSAKELEQRILHQMPQHSGGKVSLSPNRTVGSGVYSDLVGAYLKPIWNQPSRASLKGTTPEVTVSLYISSSGRVIEKKIVHRSGLTVMDNSVIKLLQHLRQVPPPTTGRAQRITIILAVEP